uniref:Uncharacterized protein n=1 Tax=Brassica oleracea TaxID=3712 RepID=A0A3P6H2S4_BRAOL|nr:unnamed protein product [Brassica oleracea]
MTKPTRGNHLHLSLKRWTLMIIIIRWVYRKLKSVITFLQSFLLQAVDQQLLEAFLSGKLMRFSD